jgi:hypothetical protein
VCGCVLNEGLNTHRVCGDGARRDLARRDGDAPRKFQARSRRPRPAPRAACRGPMSDRSREGNARCRFWPSHA